MASVLKLRCRYSAADTLAGGHRRLDTTGLQYGFQLHLVEKTASLKETRVQYGSLDEVSTPFISVTLLFLSETDS
eukprot:5458300-Pleurochrysis_carterae.AAC.3